MTNIAEIPKFYVDRHAKERMLHLAKTLVGEVLLSIYGTETSTTVSQIILDLEGEEGPRITQAMIALIKPEENALQAKDFGKTYFKTEEIDSVLAKEGGFKTNDVREEMLRELKEFNSLSETHRGLFLKRMISPLSVKASIWF